MARIRVCLDCPELTDQVRCPTHRTQSNLRQLAHKDPRYRTERWKRYSLQYRSRHPECVNAHTGTPGCTLVTDVVDHILPVRTHPELFWEPSNHRPACRVCNQRFALEARP